MPDSKKRQAISRRPRVRGRILIALGALLAFSGTRTDALAQPEQEAQDAQPAWSMPMKTMGGRQLWGDVAFFHDWRIQQNVLTGHYRLLDGKDYRYCSGTLDECRTRLKVLREERKLPPMSGKAVVLVHGIIRSSKSFGRLKERLQQEGYSVFAFDYPSTRVTIPKAAEYLRSAVKSLDGIREINFVVHSMGGLVVRAALLNGPDTRYHRMVMMGVPNLGARMADEVRDIPLYKALFGPAGQQLVTDARGLISKLPTPEFEFGILAGGRGDLNGFNPLIPGDDDGTVTVRSTRLPGAADFIRFSVLHSFLMYNADAVEATVRFVKSGRFRNDAPPQPIAPAATDEPPADERPSEATPAEKATTDD